MAYFECIAVTQALMLSLVIARLRVGRAPLFHAAQARSDRWPR
jgi:hypothetical protein